MFALLCVISDTFWAVDSDIVVSGDWDPAFEDHDSQAYKDLVTEFLAVVCERIFQYLEYYLTSMK